MLKTNNKEISPSKEIRKIFGMKKEDTMNFYNLQTWLKKMYDEQCGSAITEIEQVGHSHDQMDSDKSMVLDLND